MADSYMTLDEMFSISETESIKQFEKEERDHQRRYENDPDYRAKWDLKLAEKEARYAALEDEDDQEEGEELIEEDED